MAIGLPSSDRFSNQVPRWDDLTFPASSINPAGAATAATYNPDTLAFEFPNTGQTTIGGSGQMPHSWVAGSTLRPHLHLGCSDATAGDFVLLLEWQMRSVSSATPFNFSGWANYQSTFAAHGAANLHRIAGFGDVPGTGFTRSAVFLWRVSRLGSSAADTYNGNILVWDFDVHYQKNSFGTVEEF